MLKKNTKKINKKAAPVRSLLWIGAFLFLLSFVVFMPLYKVARMSPNQHMQEGLIALYENKYPKAKTHLLKAAQAQNAKAFFILGSMELEGQNENHKANPKEAAVYFERAASLGMSDAQYTLALLYDRGEGVIHDKQKALNWGLLAAAQGDINAQYATAVWLERGYSGKPEPYLALNYYEIAAAQGHLNSITSLISIYSGGTEIPTNKKRANYWKEQLKTLKNQETSSKQ